ncbi:hypothetical protein N9R79_06600 [Vibrio sp.]|nr:hypothetical protein [Vibrio sp.]
MSNKNNVSNKQIMPDKTELGKTQAVFGKRILVVSIDDNPSQFTQALYAINHTDSTRWPDEIYVLTSSAGRKQLINTMLIPFKGRQNTVLEQFTEDYDKVMPHYDHQHIMDIEENEAEQEKVSSFIASLCAADNHQVDVVLAGRNLTLNYHIGLAFMQSGRSQDSLSTIKLASEFSNTPYFFYPTPYPLGVCSRDGGWQNAQEATVELELLA